MIKYALFSMALFLLITVNIANAQEPIPVTNNTVEPKGLYLGGIISTNGWGGELKYIFNKRLAIRSGYETLNLTQNIDFSQDDIDFDASVDYKTGSVFVLGDFNYTRNLYISAGVMFNSFNPEVKGEAVSDMQYGDITIPASMVGDFTITITPELKVSPYGSLGVRSFLGKKKRGIWTTEIGCFYMGAPQVDIEATGLIAPTADPAQGQKEKLEYQIEQYKFYPVLKMGLAIKLF
jgi:hypothetical protein